MKNGKIANSGFRHLMSEGGDIKVPGTFNNKYLKYFAKEPSIYEYLCVSIKYLLYDLTTTFHGQNESHLIKCESV